MKQDARAIGRANLAEIRKRAVLRVEAGESPEEVISTLGMHRSNIYRWISRYREGGLEALEARKAPGKPPKLNALQTRRLLEIILDKTPLQLHFESALWTRETVRKLIREEFGIRMSDISVSRLLHKLSLSPQKPLQGTCQYREPIRKTWIEEMLPEIRKAARRAGAVVFFVSELSLGSDPPGHRIRTPAGDPPAVDRTGVRSALKVVSAVSVRGDFRFMVVHGAVNEQRFTEFLGYMLHDAPEGVFLILDNQSACRAPKVKKFIDATDGRLRVFIFPHDSTVHTPSERLQNLLSQHCPERLHG
jgi:transposase